MRYTKIALLVFGLGLVVGLVVIAVEIKWLERVASGLMALGIAALPIGMIMDWRRTAKIANPTSRRRAKAPARGARPAAPRTRKTARPKR
jgi:hypothetical protein